MFKFNIDRTKGKDILFCGIILLLTIAIGFIPLTKYYERPDSEIEARGMVLRTDDSMVFQRGIFRQGEQAVEVKLTSGPDRGKTIQAMNLLQGALELEWFYQPGEKVTYRFILKNQGEQWESFYIDVESENNRDIEDWDFEVNPHTGIGLSSNEEKEILATFTIPKILEEDYYRFDLLVKKS